MKVTIATGIFAPEIGGPATYLKELIPILKKRGWTVEVVTYGAPRKGAIAISRESPFRMLHFLRAVLKSAIDTDVVFATDTVSAGLPAAITCLLLRKRFVFRFAGDFAWETSRNKGWTSDPFDVFQKRRYSWKVELLRTLQKWVLSHAEIITVSEFLRLVLRKWGLKDVTVIRNVVFDVDLPAREILRKQFGFDKKFVLLSVGRVTVYKGVDKIIRMCAKLKYKIPELELVVVGDGPELEEAKRVAAAESITHMVEFAGKQDALTVRKYLKAADVFVLNSEYEGMSHTLLEAMTEKCPVVASGIGANVELVGKNGLIFPYNDMAALSEWILKYYGDPLLCKAVAEKAFKVLPTHEELETKTLMFLEGRKRGK